MGKTVVVGGGVIGLLSAYQLHKRGADVTVIDKGEFGRGASEGNAGWVTPGMAGPVPAPGLVWTSIKWMLSRDSPLYIKPTAVPRMASWLFSFWRHCNPRDYQAGFDATARLGQPTMQLLDELVADGVEFEMHKDGLLYGFLDEEYMHHLLDDMKILGEYGYGPPQILRGKELREFEPGLTDVVVAGAWVKEERHVRPETLTAGAAKWLEQAGVELRSGVEVTGLRRGGGKVTAVETTRGPIEAEQVLVATGAWSSRLAQMAGFNLPMQAGKGYNVTVRQPSLKLYHPIYFSEIRLAISPFEGALRASGTMELSGVNTRLDPKRVEAIRRGATRTLGPWDRGASETMWVGMRPMLPDGLPAIGLAPGYDNLYFATGHAMLGVTLAPATAAAIAELMRTGRSEFDLSLFGVGRFR